MTKKDWNNTVSDLDKLKLTPQQQKVRKENMKKYSPSTVFSPPMTTTTQPEFNMDYIRQALHKTLVNGEPMDNKENFDIEIEQFESRKKSSKKTPATEHRIDWPGEAAREFGTSLKSAFNFDDTPDINSMTNLFVALSMMVRHLKRTQLDTDVSMQKLQLDVKQVKENQAKINGRLDELSSITRQLQSETIENCETTLSLVKSVDETATNIHSIQAQIADIEFQFSSDAISRNVQTLLFPSPLTDD